MKGPHHESFLARPAIGFAVVIVIIGGISSLSCGGCAPEKSALPSAERAIEGHDQVLEITSYPRQGDTLRDLDRPIVVEFSDAVSPESFAYNLSPDSDGWSDDWAPGYRRVEINHASPFLADQSYELELSIADSAEVTITFSTQGPSSLELIARDEAFGVIDVDTAWTYRMQYVFEPDALPNGYRSMTPVRDVDGVFRDFFRVRSQLKPETLYKLRPYTVRPDHPDSVFSRYLERTDVAHSGAAAGGWIRAAYADEPDSGEGDDEETPRPTRMVPEECSSEVVVWSAPNERAWAQVACDLIRDYSMYEEFEKLLSREPLKDSVPCQIHGDDSSAVAGCVRARGGDGRLDIYLVPEGYVVPGVSRWAGVCIPEDEIYLRKSTAFILVKPGTDMSKFASTIAHEIFHAFQFAFDLYENPWWMEATATWSEEYLEPNWTTEERLPLVFYAGYHLQRQLNLEDEEHEYAVYLFPYYLEKIQPGSEQAIADIWAACETQQSLEAINSVLEDGFDETLKDFAVANLGLDPHDDAYAPPLDLYPHHEIQKWELKPDEEHEIEITDFLPPLSARYHQWINQLDPNLTPLVRFHLDDYAGNEKLLLHAIIYFDDEVREEDWSDRTERFFCINREDENFNKIILIPVSAVRPIALPPPPDNPPEGEEPPDPESMQPESMATIKISVETEACRPTMGTGEFKIEINNNWEDLAGRSSFTESVSGQVFFDEYDAGSAQYTGIAKVQYEEHKESHVREEHTLGVDWVKDSYMNKDGRGEVECTLHYPWGEEGATYNFQCGAIEYRGKGREVITYPMKGESEERTWESTGTTDLDVGYIGSYHGGLPARYDLNLNGTHLEEDISPGVNKRHFSSWNFSLQSPSPP